VRPFPIPYRRQASLPFTPPLPLPVLRSRLLPRICLRPSSNDFKKRTESGASDPTAKLQFRSTRTLFQSACKKRVSPAPADFPKSNCGPSKAIASMPAAGASADECRMYRQRETQGSAQKPCSPRGAVFITVIRPNSLTSRSRSAGIREASDFSSQATETTHK
jgi:hypothetical protein